MSRTTDEIVRALEMPDWWISPLGYEASESITEDELGAADAKPEERYLPAAYGYGLTEEIVEKLARSFGIKSDV